MFPEAIYTIEEVAQHLRVPVDAVHQEIRSGRLTAMNVANGLLRIGESDLNAYKNQARATVVAPALMPSTKDESFLKLQPGADFDHKWPDRTIERYGNVREGVATYSGKTYHVKVGFTVREVAGRPRIRCLVLIDRYATVEFAGTDDQITDSSMVASVIKDRNGKQLPVGASVPAEYQGMPVGRYRDIVDGRGASNGIAIVCQASDFETMVNHALIRYKYRDERD